MAACGCGVHAALATPKKLPATFAPQEPVTYDVSIADPSSGYIDVTATFPSGGKPTLDLAMPRWTPGSYKIRDYEKNVDDDVKAFGADGSPLHLDKPDVSHWRVETGGNERVTVRYRVYAHSELSVRTNWVDPSLALLNGAATFMTIAGDAYERPHSVRVDAPKMGGEPVSSLESKDGVLHAPTFDALVDSPIALGSSDRREIVVDGVTYVLATFGAGAVWDAVQAANDLKPILEAMHALWGKPPFDRYVFLNLLSEGGGGLEHKDSSVLMHSRWSTRTREDYLTWLSLAVHELFHAWNIKRMRPRELGPFDYMRENVTSSLWVAEGLTAYYDKLLVRRSGLSTPAEYLKNIDKAVAAHLGQLGRKVQTLCQSSRDAWTNYYQPTENSANVEVSYYEKGALVGLLLDIEIRRLTDGKKSLDDVMRTAFERFSGDEGYTPEEFEGVISEVAGVDMKPWLDRAIRSTEDLPVAEGLKSIGLRFKDEDKPSDVAYLGADTRLAGHRMVVTRVTPGTPAAEAGVMVGDEVIAIGDFRVEPGELDKRLARYKAGEATTITVARRDAMMTLPVTFGTAGRKSWAVELDPTADAATVARRVAWMGA